jgi:multiple sugar transport system ATP-binding protein
MRVEIKKLHHRLGNTIIYVTHDQVEAMTMANRIFIMNHGRLQQSGAPLEVYRQPANRFVAGFIGSPAMNFMDATLVREEAGFAVDAGGFRLRLPVSLHPGLDAYAGRPVVFGVRPEDIAMVGADPGSGATLRARAEVVETLGAETFVHLSCGGHTLVARIDSPERPIAVGETLTVELKMVKTHLFDNENSRTIV